LTIEHTRFPYQFISSSLISSIRPSAYRVTLFSRRRTKGVRTVRDAVREGEPAGPARPIRKRKHGSSKKAYISDHRVVLSFRERGPAATHHPRPEVSEL